MEAGFGVQISRRMFIQTVLVLFLLMMAAGVLTRLVPAGMYARVDVNGRQTLVPGSFQFTPAPDYPVWRWFTAPVEVLGAPGSATIIVIIIFLLFIGGAFAILEKSGIIHAVLGHLVTRFQDRKYTLLLAISFLFMSIGAFFGIFEEVVPLLPIMIALSYSLGWDALTGLGMSVLAVNLGFSAAITNPFTIGVAQNLAGLPLFSGAGFRIVVFLVIYAVFAWFITRYARHIERNPSRSPLFNEDQAEREKYRSFRLSGSENPRLKLALFFFGGFILLIFVVLVSGPFIPAISEFALPLVGILFLAGGIAAGLIAGSGRTVWPALLQGVKGMLPAIPLILMAMSVKHIVTQGGILDTILHQADAPLAAASPFGAAILIYVLALIIEFFISSGSAKAFLMMPILIPLADLVGVSRQVTVLAYQFGDGFTNLIYPTSAILLICLGLARVSYLKW
ncbi:MAG: AbgT family transporter, partial [Anaerolineaceae bacterium]